MNSAWNLLYHPETERVGWTLLHFLWQGIVVAALLRITLGLLRRSSANARYACCCAAMLTMAVMPAMTFLLLPRPEHAPATPTIADQARQAAWRISTPSAPRQELADAPRTTFAEHLRPMLPYLVAIWTAGVLGLMVYHATGWIYLSRLKRHHTRLLEPAWQARLTRLASRLGLRRSVGLLESALVRAPAVFGWLRPVILVPASVLSDLTPQQLDAILVHELAHVRRNDYLVNLAQVAIETLLFYHPATWWISCQVRQERENCCDDLAIEFCGDRLLYAQSLASMEELGVTCGELALGAGGGKLLLRIRRLLAPSAAKPRPGRGALVVAFLGFVSILLPVLAVQLRAADPEPKIKAPITSPILPEDLKVISEDYLIGANDLLTITITSSTGEEKVRTTRISEAGTLRLPQIEQPLKVADLTERQLEKAISQKVEGKITVTVVEVRGRTFTIIGAVVKPGQYAIPKNDFHLSKALTAAGGVKGKPDKLYVYRRAEPKVADGEKVKETPQRVLEVPIAEILAANPRYDVVICPQDSIVVLLEEKADKKGGN
jgi:beta-lactamase regulating signal transducer with metallopeptidase domain